MWSLLLLLVGVAVAHPNRRNSDVCSQPMDPGPCEGFQNSWYYDADVGTCMDFIYGGCGGNDNRFDTTEECAETCTPHDEGEADPCSLPMDAGNCEDYDAFETSWYYDSAMDGCMDFIYTGCGGNANRFSSEEECQEACP